MKALATLMLCLVLASCSGPFGWNTEGYVVLHDDLDTAWIATAALEYRPDSIGGYWKSPHETERDGGGDCEDIATYLVYRLGQKSALVLVQESDGSGHCIVKYNNQYLEPQMYDVYYAVEDIVITLELSYEETMAYATHQGSKYL